MYSETVQLKSLHPVQLSPVNKSALRSYFVNTWELYELLFSSLKNDNVYYKSPDPLRNPLIFYWGHTAAFYINKLKLAKLISKGINMHFEDIFARGVDPDLPEHLDVQEIWPTIKEVDEYRKSVYDIVLSVIEEMPEYVLINQKSPYWALLISIEHDRIHFETSSVLIRQLDISDVSKPEKLVVCAEHRNSRPITNGEV